jgi:hypothetical protein
MFRALSCRIAMLAIIWFCALGGSGTAHAFSAPGYYFAPATQGGSAGRWFTGSPADGYECSACHLGGQSWPVYVTGLPSQGYVPATKYDLRMLWPEFSDHENALLAASNQADPTMELVTELVAESGMGSGKLEIKDVQLLSPAEKCARPPGQRATKIWTVTPDQDMPTDIRLECNAAGLNQRCLVTVEGCGAREVRMTWTAPEQWQGNIWFSAGFVSTDQASAKPNDADGVTMLSIPLAPAASSSAGYVSKLESGCSVRGVHAPSRTVGWLGFSFGLVVLRRVRRRRRREARS